MSTENGASTNGTGKAPATTADYGKTASFLAVGVGLTGVITYAYFLIASHTLSGKDYGQITVLWSAVFITISALYRPIEQLLSRHISERVVKGQSLILGAVLFIAAVQLFALGVIGDLLAGQRVMTQRVFERVRRVELALGVEPSHYEPGQRSD